MSCCGVSAFEPTLWRSFFKTVPSNKNIKTTRLMHWAPSCVAVVPWNERALPHKLYNSQCQLVCRRPKKSKRNACPFVPSKRGPETIELSLESYLREEVGPRWCHLVIPDLQHPCQSGCLRRQFCRELLVRRHTSHMTRTGPLCPM